MHQTGRGGGWDLVWGLTKAMVPDRFRSGKKCRRYPPIPVGSSRSTRNTLMFLRRTQCPPNFREVRQVSPAVKETLDRNLSLLGNREGHLVTY